MKVMKLVRHWYQQDQKYKKTIKLQFAKTAGLFEVRLSFSVLS